MELEPPGIIPPDDDPVLGRDPVVEAVEKDVEAGRLEQAVARAREALESGEGNRLDLLFIAGDALLELGRPSEAEVCFREVLQSDAHCPSSRCWLAMSLYRQGKFADAKRECERVLAADTPAIDAHVVHGLLLERAGQYAEADECFRAASELDPMRFAAPVRLSRAEFDEVMLLAAKKLPRQFRKHLERVSVVVEACRLMSCCKPVTGSTRISLAYSMACRCRRHPSSPQTNCDRPTSTCFNATLNALPGTEEGLVEQISVTLYHELAHYLGFEEDEMGDMGLD